MEKFLTNKYFCLAVIIALVVVTYLYTQKTNSCKIEGMRNVDFSMLAPELTDRPWADADELRYKRVGGRFDKLADETTKQNLAKAGYAPVDFLKSTSQVYDSYIKYEAVDDQVRKERYGKGVPTGYDRRDQQMTLRDESKCKPCKCDVDLEEDSEESEEIEYRPRKSKRNRRKYRKN